MPMQRRAGVGGGEQVLLLYTGVRRQRDDEDVVDDDDSQGSVTIGRNQVMMMMIQIIKHTAYTQPLCSVLVCACQHCSTMWFLWLPLTTTTTSTRWG